MALEHRGIILFQRETQVSVVDECCGRIVARTFEPLLVGGVYIYNLEFFAGKQTIKQQELDYLPVHIVHEDFLFLHHLFELTLVFAPEGSYAQGLFSLFVWLYSKPASWFSEKNKKFFLFKILSFLGIWSSEGCFYDTLLKIAEFPIDRLNEEILELISEEELEQWLTKTLLSHPLLPKMKTKLFLESVLLS